MKTTKQKLEIFIIIAGLLGLCGWTSKHCTISASEVYKAISK